MLEPLEQVVYGFPLGVVLASLTLLALACVIGFSSILVMAVGAICTLAAALLSPGWRSVGVLRMWRFNQRATNGIAVGPGATVPDPIGGAWELFTSMPLLVIGVFVLLMGVVVG